jgi:glucose/arabinose dehydrogenase
MRRLLPVLALALAPALLPAQELPADLRFETFVSGLNQPLGVRHAGDSRLFVIQQSGQIRLIAGGVLQATPFLNFVASSGGTPPPQGFTSGGERGLLGLAFAPDYAASGVFYVHYTDGNGDTVIARYRRSAGDANLADAASGEAVLRIDQDYANHNGGDLHFGLDGMLYIGMGDGGSGNDPCNRAQTLAFASLSGAASGGSGNDCPADTSFLNGGGQANSRALLGKLLRIDVSTAGTGGERCGLFSGGSGYGIPNDNPYAGSDGICDEVFASGLRNPYRFSFDRLHGDIWIGDVGQGAREEMDRNPATVGGLNFGWRCREGFIATPGISCTNPPSFTDPIADYPRDQGQSITGGFRYRGPIGGLHGLVFYGDFVSGRQFVLSRRSGSWVQTVWRATGGNPAGYGEDLAGNLYLADYGGTIFRLAATSPVIFRSGVEADE